jgi:hypothetical protein
MGRPLHVITLKIAFSTFARACQSPHTTDVGAGLRPAPTIVNRYGLPEIIRAFKAFSSRRINELRGTPGIPIWQRNYYEHVIRDEEDLNQIREYIINNPLKWDLDGENPMNLKVSK